MSAAGVRLRAVIDGPGKDGSTGSVPEDPGREGLRQASSGGVTERHRRAVVMLHGFTGSADSMTGVAEPLSERRRVVRLELVGHGGSDAPAELARYTMAACSEQILAAVSALGLERPHLIGYSMGGRAALAAAIEHPEAFASLILVGATAGIRDEDARRERLAADEALADRIEREGIEAFVDYWMSLPLFASQARLGQAALARARAERLRQRPEGLANSLRGMGAGAQPPLHDRLDRFRGPVLLVVGEQDAKFRAIAEGLEAALPAARLQVLPDVGHAAHLEAPTAFASLAEAFLDAQDERRGASSTRMS